MAEIYIRPLTPDDWQALKAIRLRALQLHPEVYSGRYEDAVHISEERWRDVSGKSKQIFGLYEGEKLIGITGVFGMEPPNGHQGFMGMTFIEPNYRGHGLSNLLFKARIDFARSCPQLTKLVVSHREKNEASRAAILKHGFELVGKEKVTWPDGHEAYDIKYELDLVSLRAQAKQSI